MIRRWLALTYYLYASRLAALSHFYFNRLYLSGFCPIGAEYIRQPENVAEISGCRFMGGKRKTVLIKNQDGKGYLLFRGYS